MPAELWTEVQRTAGCAAAVAAAAGPLGLLGWAIARRTGEPVLPRPARWRVPWTGLDVALAFLLLVAVLPAVALQALAPSGFFPAVYGPAYPTGDPPAFEPLGAAVGAAAAAAVHEDAGQWTIVRRLWAGAFALPVQLGAVAAVWLLAYRRWRPPGRSREVPARVALAVAVWAGLLAAVQAVHVAVTAAFLELGWPPEEHPLTRLTARPVLDQLLLVFEAAVAAPLVEELVFRGLLLPWLLGGAALGGARPAWRLRVWGALAAAVLLAAASVRPAPDPASLLGRGPVLFAVVLVAGWAVLAAGLRRKARTVGAVYASAALFAVIHSAVWPTPVPLFVLGLGLGWLAVRTRGFLAAAAVHGLFNLVSVLLVLRVLRG